MKLKKFATAALAAGMATLALTACNTATPDAETTHAPHRRGILSPPPQV